MGADQLTQTERESVLRRQEQRVILTRWIAALGLGLVWWIKGFFWIQPWHLGVFGGILLYNLLLRFLLRRYHPRLVGALAISLDTIAFVGVYFLLPDHAHTFHNLLFPIAYAAYQYRLPGGVGGALGAVAFLAAVYNLGIFPFLTFEQLVDRSVLFGVAGVMLGFLFQFQFRYLIERARRERARMKAQLYEATQQQLRQTETLLAVSQTVGSTPDLTEVVRRATREMARALGADIGGAWRLSADRSQLMPLAGYHVPPELVEIFARTPLPFGDRLIEEATRFDGPIHSSDSQADPRFDHPLARLVPHKSILVRPMWVKGEIIGGIAIAWVRESHQFTSEELRLVEGITRQAAIAIENARLLEAEREVRQRLEISESRYRELFDNLIDIVYVHDLEGKILAINEAGVRASGYTREELHRMNIAQFIAPQNLARSMEMIRRLIGGERVSEFFTAEAIRKDGTRGFLECSGRLVFKDGVPVAIQGVARDITARRKLEARQAAFVEIVKELAAASDFDRLFPLIGERICRLLGTDSAALVLIEGDEVVNRGTYGFDDTIRVRTRRKLSESRARRIVLTRKPHVSTDMAADPYWRDSPIVTQHGHRAILEVPVTLRGEIVGVLGALHKSPRAFSEDDVALLASLADHIAVALDQASLVKELKERAEKLTALSTLIRLITSMTDSQEVFHAVARAATTLMGAKLTRVWVADSGARVLRAKADFVMDSDLVRAASDVSTIPYGSGLAGQVLESRTPEYVLDAHQDFRWLDQRLTREAGLHAYAGIPLIFRDHMVGVLAILFGDRRQFTPEEKELMRLLADQAAIAITNASLYEETQAGLRETQTLLSVSQAVSSTLDLTEIMRRVARETARALGADMVGAYLADPDETVLRPLAGYHVPKHLLDAFGQFPIPLKGHRFLEEAWESKRPVSSSNALADARIDRETLERFPHRSVLFFPMVVKGKPIGGLFAIWWEQTHHFTSQELRLVEGISYQAALAIDNARLYRGTREVAERLHLLGQAVAAIGEVIVVTDLEGRVVFVNDAIKAVFGYSPQEALGRYSRFLWAPSTPKGQTKAVMDATVAGGWRGEVRGIRANGSEFPVALTTAPVRNESGQPVALVGVVHDLTREKGFQLQLIQAEKLATTGQLAAGVAHEINNPLAVILGFSSLALEKHPPKDLVDELETIRAQALRAAKIVQDLLDFARPTPQERLPVDLNEVLRETFALQAYHLATDQIEVVWNLAEPLPKTLADRHQLQQVLLNLVLNAHQAMRTAHGRGTLWIESGSDGIYVWAKIRDDGPGIAPDLLPRVFDPFLTTKPVGQGVGLGLSISYGIIQAHGGHLLAESEIGQGATFMIALPALESDAGSFSHPLKPAPAPTRSLSVLVVDDEPTVAGILSLMLEHLGHRADVAHSGSEALMMLARGSYDLMTLDLKMPHMSGQDVWRALQTANLPRRPKVLFVTGDIVAPETRAFLIESGQPYLEKPFQLADLSQKINELRI